MILESILILLIVLVIAVCLITLHKVRRAHLMLFAIARDAAEARTEVKQIYPQLQSYFDLVTLLGLRAPLSQLRGWASSPDFLLEIARRCLQRRPVTVLECSSGASTVVLARCCQMNGHGHVYSLEHDPLYAGRTQSLLKHHQLDSWATIIDAPLKTWPQLGQKLWYSLDLLPSNLGPIDLLVIDGPPKDIGIMARYPALSLLRPYFAPSITVLMDDASRPDERAIVEAWKAENPDFRFELLPLEKGCAIGLRKTS
jgi:predicted O-methyltransferase YrrM